MVKADTANAMLKSMTQRYEAPGKIFCSRELETGLNEFVANQKAKGVMPSDEDLRAEGRRILKLEQTSADDQQLLDKFKGLHGIPSIQYTTPENQKPSPEQKLDESASMDDILFGQFDTQLSSMDMDTIANMDLGFDLTFPDASTF